MSPKRPAPKRYPALPSVLHLAGGDVTIATQREVIKSEDGDVCNGLYDHERRHILIDAKLPKAHQWRTLYHELFHVAVLDSGLDNGLDHRMHEALADAVATARLRERFG